jgi:Lar family restriction alleviation protein
MKFNKKLKPCPFCGGQADLCKDEWNPKSNLKYFVICSSCGITTECKGTKRSVIKIWNRRINNVL